MSEELNEENHAYLGDGLYIESTPVHFILRGNDHRDEHCTDKVYIEQDIFVNMLGWILEIKRKGNPSIVKDFALAKFFRHLADHCEKIESANKSPIILND